MRQCDSLTSVNRRNMMVLIFNQSHPMSRTPNSRKEETHERIVDAAARAIQRHGYAGVGVADVMKEAGLTHGGFYAHFDSREALVIEAFAYAMDRGTERWRKLAEQTPPDKRLATIVGSYLTAVHRDDPGPGW